MPSGSGWQVPSDAAGNGVAVGTGDGVAVGRDVLVGRAGSVTDPVAVPAPPHPTTQTVSTPTATATTIRFATGAIATAHPPTDLTHLLAVRATGACRRVPWTRSTVPAPCSLSRGRR